MLLSLLVVIFVLCLYRLEYRFKGFNGDYLSKYRTDSIKGIFILLIVLTHSLQYIEKSTYLIDNQDSSIGVNIYVHSLQAIGQLVVVMFLFYSGYGVGVSFKKKGASYVKSMPRHRILGTLLNYDVAVLVFIIACLVLCIPITPKQCLLSLIAWEDVGNSNWYIFVILVCYALTYLTLTFAGKKPILQVGLLSLLCFLTVCVLSRFRGNWWYDTLLCYPAGFAFSTYKDKIESFIKKNYWLLLVLLCISFVLIRYFGHFDFDKISLSSNILSIVFAFVVLMITMKFSIGNRVLEWFGKNLFPIYIYMRLPMIIIEQKNPEMIAAQPSLFIVISLAVTVLIASVYKYWQIRI